MSDQNHKAILKSHETPEVIDATASNIKFTQTTTKNSDKVLEHVGDMS
jgi:hypothetical protein